MKLQEIFDQLSSGEFSQLSIGGLAAGVIDEDNQAKVLNHINLGLTALFRRFTLKQGRLVLQLQNEMTLYPLKSKFAVNRYSGETVRYILDTPTDKFYDDILKIERVVDEQGCELSLNDASDPDSLTTPSTTTLFVPEVVPVQKLEVFYRANHPKVGTSVGYIDPSQIEVNLPDSHLEPLLYFVASRVHNPIGMSNEFHAGNSYAAKYEMACQELESAGLQIDQGGGNDRLQRNGWV